MPASHLIPDGLLPNTTYAPTAPLSPQKMQSLPPPRRSPSPVEESLYNAVAIRQAFSSTLQRRPTPPRAAIPATRAPRVPSNLAEQKPVRRPSTFKDQQANLTQAEMASNGHTSPTKTESSYKTANDIDGDQERSNDGVRPPSTYSHDSIGGGVIAHKFISSNIFRDSQETVLELHQMLFLFLVRTSLVPHVLLILILLHQPSIYMTALLHEILLKDLTSTNQGEYLPVLVFHRQILQRQSRRTIRTDIQDQVLHRISADERVERQRRLPPFLELQ